MPEAARLVGVNVDVFFLQLGVFVVTLRAPIAEARLLDMDYARRSLARAVVAHEGKTEGLALLAELPHLSYCFVDFHFFQIKR